MIFYKIDSFSNIIIIFLEITMKHSAAGIFFYYAHYRLYFIQTFMKLVTSLDHAMMIKSKTHQFQA